MTRIPTGGDDVVLAAAAHAGGWDELLLLGVPLALFAVFRWLAVRREDDAGRDDATSADDR